MADRTAIDPTLLRHVWEQPMDSDFAADQRRQGVQAAERCTGERFELTCIGTASMHSIDLRVAPRHTTRLGRSTVILSHSGTVAETLALCEAFEALKRAILATGAP